MQESKIQKVILTVIFILIYTTTSLIRINAQSEDIIMEFEQVAQVSTGGDTFQTEVVDDVAYVIDMQAGLKAYDVSRPKRPRLLDSFNDGGVPHNFMIDAGADLLYLADHADGLEIYDISDPSNLDKIGEISDSGDGETDGVFVSDGIAYTAEWHDSTWSWKMVLINVSDPSSPQRISEYTDGEDEFIRFFVQEDVCYTACLGSGFKVLNVSDPYAVTEIDVFDEGGYTWSIDIKENRAYISSTDFFILNLTDVENISKICNYTAENAVSPIHIEDDFAFLGIHNTGIQVLNISTEVNPTIIGSYWNGAENVVGITKSKEYLYLSAHGDGLLILEIEGEPKIDSFSTGLVIFSSLMGIMGIILYLKRKKG